MLKRFFRNPGPHVQFRGPESIDGRSLQQWIAGILGKVQETPQDVQLGPGNITRTWMLTGFPEGPAYLGRLNRLLKFCASDPAASQVQVRLTHHLMPAALPDTLRTRWLRNRQEGMVTHTEAHGLVDAGTAKGLKAYEEMYHAVNFREDCIYRVWIAVTVSAPDRITLNRVQQKLLQAVRTMALTVTPLYKEQVEGLAFSHVLGQRQDRLLKAWPGRLTHAEPLSYLYPFLHGSINEGQGSYVGHANDSLGFRHAIYLDFTRGTGPMAWIIAGMSGEGKSTFIKAVNLSLLLAGFVIYQFDWNGEYKAFTDYVGGVHVDTSTASGRYFEPLVIPAPVGDADYDRGRFTRTCDVVDAVLRALVPDLTSREKDLADQLLMLTWRQAGVDRDKPETWNRTARMHDWYRLLCQDTREVPEGLRSKLSSYFEGTRTLFQEAVEPAWGDVPFVRIAVGDVVANNAASERVAAAKTLMVTHRVWDAVVANKFAGRRFAMVNIDEGQRVLRDPNMADHIYRLATDGRKFNAGLSVAANDINVFFETEGGRGLWENASLRCMFYMQDSGLKKAVENAGIPQEVVAQVRQLHETYQYMLSRDLRRWTLAKMELPEAELELYKTRELKGAGTP